MSKLTEQDLSIFNKHAVEESGHAIHDYQALTRQLRVEENPEDILSFLTTILQKGSETGEIQGKIAKSIRDRRELWIQFGVRTMIKQVLDSSAHDQIMKELGDDLFYISEMCNHLGITLFDLMIGNIEKLASRDSRGTLRGSGDDR